MKTSMIRGTLIATFLACGVLPSLALGQVKPPPKVYPAALFPLQERGGAAKELGAKVTDVVFATLATDAGLILVDRDELDKTLQEQGLNLSGAVKPDEATKIGQITGAKVLVTGSVVHVDKTIYLIAKIIGTETSRVVGVSVKGKASDDIGPLAEQLAQKIAETIRADASTLVAKEADKADVIADLKAKFKDNPRPAVMVAIAERHVGQATIDPAAETELALICKETGFELVDADEGTKGKADVLIRGEGFSEFAGRLGNLVSVRARLEVKAVDRRTGQVLAVDRQTVRVVDLSEQVAGKTALQEAAEQIAVRLLPKLVKEKP